MAIANDDRFVIEGLIRQVGVELSAMTMSKVLHIALDVEDIAFRTSRLMSEEADEVVIHIGGKTFKVVPTYKTEQTRVFTGMKEVIDGND